MPRTAPTDSSSHRRRRQQLQPADEEDRGPAGGLHVGQALVVDHPARVRRGSTRAPALDQPPQDGRSHERAALGQGGRPSGRRPRGAGPPSTRPGCAGFPPPAGAGRWRRGCRASAGGGRAAPPRSGRRRRPGPGCRPRGPRRLLPVGQEAQRRSVRPLAVVEQDDDSRRPRPVAPCRPRQCVQERAQGLDAAGLAVGLGPEVGAALPAQDGAEGGQGGDHRVGPVAHCRPQALGQPRLVPTGVGDARDQSLEQLEGTPSRLFHPWPRRIQASGCDCWASSSSSLLLPPPDSASSRTSPPRPLAARLT